MLMKFIYSEEKISLRCWTNSSICKNCSCLQDAAIATIFASTAVANFANNIATANTTNNVEASQVAPAPTAVVKLQKILQLSTCSYRK